KAGGDERDGRETGALDCRAGPQHGGRAGASGSDAGNDGVDLVPAQLRRQVGQDLFLVDAMRGAERVVLDEGPARVFLAGRFANGREDFFAAEHAVPHFSDGLAVQIVYARIEIALVPVRFPERPYSLVLHLLLTHEYSCRRSSAVPAHVLLSML